MQPMLVQHLGRISAGAGIGLSAVGVGIGVGLIFASAIQAVARQPEMAKQVQVLMYIGFAIVEGAGLLGIVLCYLAING